jgi:competence protein ComEC
MSRSSLTSGARAPDATGAGLVALSAATVVSALAGSFAPPSPAFAAPLAALVVVSGWSALRRGGRGPAWWAACGALLGLFACAVAPRWPTPGARTVPARFTFSVRDGWTRGVRGWGTRVRVLSLETGAGASRVPRDLDLYVTAPVGRAQLPAPGTRWEGSGEMVRVRPLPLAAGYLRVKTLLLLKPLAETSRVDGLRDRLVRSLQRAAGVSPARLRAAGLAAALALQRREELQPAEVASMRRSGLVHLLSVSGLHVGLVGVLVWGGLSLAGVRPGVRRWFVAASLAGFAVLAGGNAPVLRAAAAGIAYLVARQLGRPLEPLPVVWAIVAGLVVLQPAVLLQPGFELSAFVTLALVRWIGPMTDALAVLPLRAAQAIAVALVAQAASAPLVGGYFAALPPLGVLANLAAAPLELLLVGASLLALALAPVSAALGGLALLAVAGGKTLLDLASSLGGLGAWAFPPPSPALAVAAAAFGLAALTRSRISGAAALLVVAGTAAWVGLPQLSRGPVHAIRLLGVQEGMALLVQSDGAAVLVDGGRSPVDAWRELAGARVRRLDALVVTHQDADHTGGAAMILERLPVRRLCFPEALGEREEIFALRREARWRGVEEVALRPGTRVRLGAIACEVLWPPAAVEGIDNDASLVARLTVGGVAVLVSGDLEAPGERALLASGASVAADVLQLPHHGSRSSSTPAFLAAVRPVVALAATGRRPRFAYPHPLVVGRVVSLPAVLVGQAAREGTVAWAETGRLLVGAHGRVRVARSRGAAGE